MIKIFFCDYNKSCLNLKSSVLFCSVLPFFLFAGCDALLKDDYKITNSSSNTVTFTIKEKGSSAYKLDSSECEIFTLYDYPKIEITSTAHQTYYYDDGDIVVYDMARHTLNVENQTQKTVYLFEDNNLIEDYAENLPIVKNGNCSSYAYGHSFYAVDEDGIERELVFNEKDDIYYVAVR